MRGWLGALTAGCLLLSGCTGGGEQPVAEDSTTPAIAETASPSNPLIYKYRLRGPQVRADIDGDGSQDLVQLWLRRNQLTREWRGRVVAKLASGDTTSTPWQYTYYETMDRLQGRVDVDGDGDDEVVLYNGGNSSFHAELLTYVHGNLTFVRDARHPKQRAGLAFGFHGNYCGPCTGDSTCQLVDGEPRIVLSESHYPFTGRSFSPEGTWSARIYALRGEVLQLVERHQGTVGPGVSLPASYAFDGNLNCGTAFWSLGSD